MQNLNKITHLFLKNLGNLNNKNIICGFSGGADSTALLSTLIEKKEHFGFNLKAVFFTHGESPIAVDEDKMFQFCTSFCTQHNIPLIIEDLKLEKIQRQGWESSGRKARQNFYKEQNVDYVFLGHHKDDQNETTMTQLLRGGGRGASAMKEIDGVYCRPFLKIHKKDIYDYLKSKNISWIEDPTNTNTDFTRNFWRNIGLPTIAQHYPDYSQNLDNFRQKNTELNDLAFELAEVDGLHQLVEGKSISVKDLSSTRLKNLIVHYFKANGKNMENAFFDQQIAHYKANNKLYVNQKGIEFFIEKGVFSFSKPTHNLKVKIK